MHKFHFVRIGTLDNSQKIKMINSTSFGASQNSDVIIPPFGTDFIDVLVKAIHFTGS